MVHYSAHLASTSLCLMGAVWIVFTLQSDAAQRVYLGDCGSTSYLAFKPGHWSNGCTGGSFNVRSVEWRFWGRHTALGVGTAWHRVDVRVPPYKTPARVRLSHVRSCTSKGGAQRLYFSRARFAAKYGGDNPFGFSPGWHQQTLKVIKGLCRLSRIR
jgi:hypothetical protein